MSNSDGDITGKFTFLRYTPSGIIRYLWLRATRRRIVVAGECKMCGRCCTNLNLSYCDRWIRREDDFRKLMEKYPEYERYIISGRSPEGLLMFKCRFITDEGLCGDHESRPDICREYPQPDLPFSGARLLEHCGYRFVVAPSFGKFLEREKKRAERGRGPDFESEPEGGAEER